MRYEGKLYGKVAGKYIEVTDHVSNDDLILKLESLISDCDERAQEFFERKMDISEASCLAMATAYRVVINIIKREQ